MPKLIILSAGHSNVKGRDRGAAANGFVEGDLTVELRQLIAIELKKLGVSAVMDGNNSILVESINYFKKYFSTNSIAIEFHWNSGSPEATGVETFIPDAFTTTEKLYAEALSQTVRDTLGIKSRGNNGVRTELESHHKSLGWMKQTGVNLLLEVCFISNVDDMKKYQTNKPELARKLAALIYNFAMDNYVKPKPQITYVVKVNDTLFSIAKMYSTSVDVIKKNNNFQGDHIFVGQEIKI